MGPAKDFADYPERRLLAEAIPQMAFLCRPDGVIEYFNRKLEAFVGDSLPLHPEDRPRWEALWQEALAAREGFRAEFRIQTLKGRYRWGLAQVDLLDRGFWIGTWVDIEDVRQAAQAEERHRIAREIHDELGQSLTVLKMGLARLKNRLPVLEQVLREEAESLGALVGQTIQSVRRIAADLRPIQVESLGLYEASLRLLKDFEKRTGIGVVLNWQLGDEFPEDEISIALFRILQEALTNAARHSGTDRVDVTFQRGQREGHREGAELCLIVRDFGSGLSTAGARFRKKVSVGLGSMRERARGLGGRFEIESVAPCGTRVVARIPVGQEIPCIIA